MATLPEYQKGLGKLIAYIGVEEGVAFKMDNNQFWDTMCGNPEWTIMGSHEKRESSKFFVVRLPSRKVMLRNRLGMCLAPVEKGTEPKTFPVVPVPCSKEPEQQFEVFYKGNKIAFQASNGLFLGRICKDFTRDVHVLEASMFFPDETCFFQPLIWDIDLPTFEFLHVIPEGISKLKYSPYLVQKSVIANTGEEPLDHTFRMTYNARCSDKVFWNNLWGLGLTTLGSFKVDSAKPVVMYSENNDYMISHERIICEEVTEEVIVVPKTKVTASLNVDRQLHAVLPFVTAILKKKPNGDDLIFGENAAWKGIAYRNPRIDFKVVKI